jgi:hypothetical protein
MLFLERWSVLLALPGALILALNLPYSKYAFIFFLVSNILALILFYKEQRRWFLLQTLIYFVINLIGVYRWLLS